MYDSPTVAGEMKTSLTLTSKMLPEIEDWKVGEKYTLTVTVEQTEVHKAGTDQLCAHFDVLSVKPSGKKEKPEKVAEAVKSKIETEEDEY